MKNLLSLCCFFLALSFSATGQPVPFLPNHLSNDQNRPWLGGLVATPSLSIAYANNSPSPLLRTGKFRMVGLAPLYNAKMTNWGSVGLGLSDEQNNFNGFKVSSAQGTFAVNKSLSRRARLTMGGSVGADLWRFSMDDHTTGSQWEDVSGFVPSAANGESFERLSGMIARASIGALLSGRDTTGLVYHLGFSTAGTRGRGLLVGEMLLEKGATYEVSGGVRVFQRDLLRVFSGMVWQYGQARQQLEVLALARYALRDQGPYQSVRRGAVDLCFGWSVNQTATAGLFLHQPGFSVGVRLGGPTPFSRRDVPARTFEVGLIIRKDRKKEEENTTVPAMAPHSPRDFDTKTGPKREAPVTTQVPTPPQEIRYVQVQKLSDDLPDSVSYIQWVGFHHQFRFGFNSAELDPRDIPYLDSLAQILRKEADMKVVIIGHTDNIGSLRINHRVSYRRATAVYEFLRSRGISEERMAPVGKGAMDPLVENTTEETRARNRRVEFIFYK